MQKTDIEQTLKNIISKQLNISSDEINSQASLESLGADSLDRVEIVMKIEEEFNLEINDEDAENITTLSSAVDYIYNLKN